MIRQSHDMQWDICSPPVWRPIITGNVCPLAPACLPFAWARLPGLSLPQTGLTTVPIRAHCGSRLAIVTNGCPFGILDPDAFLLRVIVCSHFEIDSKEMVAPEVGKNRGRRTFFRF